MNFLAHLHLSEPTPEARLGNLLGDFVRGRPHDGRFPPAVWRGIVEHRAVDAFADRHSEWRACRDLLAPVRRRIAGIAVDVLFDHLLARSWSRFEGRVTFEGFVAAVHRDLRAARRFAPEEAREIHERLIRERWLLSYRDLGGVREVLARMEQRTPALAGLGEAADGFVRRREDVVRCFARFYPDAMRFVSLRRATESSRFTSVSLRRSRIFPLR